MSGLREKQKADRRRRILEAACKLFAKAGPDATTIEAIADAAGVSGVTVHNYYGTKSGVLLALVAESDRELLEKMARELPGQSDDVIDLARRFAAIIRDHAITFLDKEIWRQVFAASIAEANSRFGKSYHSLDHQLALVLVREIEVLQARGAVSPDVSAYDLGKAIFSLQNMRFVNFISFDEMTDVESDAAFLRDLRSIFGALPPDRR
ncbi:MAG: TetR/AcrR family transcriptional regulator [Thioclava sp.]|nr:TetR/AcrR family transcriptional regulator [Thioclava sp.]MBD3802926.1 TetR/AcrR family transcriptional regulator [Thioclava sp.]